MDPSLPNGVQWLRLHECWLPDVEVSSFDWASAGLSPLPVPISTMSASKTNKSESHGCIPPEANAADTSGTIDDCTISLFVKVIIDPSRRADFLSVMAIDAEGSRSEPGCLRFEVLKGDAENEYWFNEVYRDKAAVIEHKQQPHFKAWEDFKQSGGVEKIEVVKASRVL